MVYGRILYNNIKEYTPKWFKTVPYSHTARPTFSRGRQVESAINSKSSVKNFWRFFGRTVQANPWMWQVFIFCIAFGWFHIVYDPFLAFYKLNNRHRTLDAALEKERAYKKKMRELEQKGEN